MAKRERNYMTIGEVVSRLKDKFPGLSISKVRYLEEEGLIKPERTKGGYRKFSEENIKRLETILRLQKKKFLPLDVIRERLRLLDKGESLPEFEEVPLTECYPFPEETQVSLEDVSQLAGLSTDEIKDLESFGIVKPKQTEEGRIFSSLDVNIMRIARSLSRYGIEPRHLRMYENFAEREASFFQQILLPTLKQKSPEGRERTIERLSELVKLSEEFKRLVLQKTLRCYFPEL
ncbi:MAG: MerR family transcriptional regulator [Actinomycetota bacterium]|nr:MerR family transcriptional regulator [Actinomycetota bacterium]MDI6822038.1 MerR family transcriptional regulator [Actinomycetota bacterium]